jgi:hypothetical protein
MAKVITETDKAWIAGVIEGCGKVSWVKHRKGSLALSIYCSGKESLQKRLIGMTGSASLHRTYKAAGWAKPCLDHCPTAHRHIRDYSTSRIQVQGIRAAVILANIKEFFSPSLYAECVTLIEMQIRTSLDVSSSSTGRQRAVCKDLQDIGWDVPEW